MDDFFFQVSNEEVLAEGDETVDRDDIVEMETDEKVERDRYDECRQRQ